VVGEKGINMKPFQVLLLLVLFGFLAVQIYDRVEARRRLAEQQESARVREVWDGLHRCEDSLPADATAARQQCKDFWLPQLNGK
jgi:hypothetical protein